LHQDLVYQKDKRSLEQFHSILCHLCSLQGTQSGRLNEELHRQLKLEQLHLLNYLEQLRLVNYLEAEQWGLAEGYFE
jgi:hypothetical protein